MTNSSKFKLMVAVLLVGSAFGVWAANEININSTFKVTDGFWDYTRTVKDRKSVV